MIYRPHVASRKSPQNPEAEAIGVRPTLRGGARGGQQESALTEKKSDGLCQCASRQFLATGTHAASIQGFADGDGLKRRAPILVRHCRVRDGSIMDQMTNEDQRSFKLYLEVMFLLFTKLLGYRQACCREMMKLWLYARVRYFRIYHPR